MSIFDLSGLVSPLFPLPLWKLLLDVVCATVMWALLVRFAVILLLGTPPSVRGVAWVIRFTEGLMSPFSRLTPAFLNSTAHSLYAAFLVFLLRYYGLPMVNGYTVNNPINLPLEARLVEALSDLLRLL